MVTEVPSGSSCEQFTNELIAAIRDQGSCVIMVTHDEALVDALGARRVMFEEAKA